MNGGSGTGSKEAFTSRLLAEAIVSLVEDVTILKAYLKDVAIFKAKVQYGGSIKIPEEELQFLGIRQGDYVVVILSKIERKSGDV